MPVLSLNSAPPARVTITLPPDADGKAAKLFLRPWGAAQRLAALRGYLQALQVSGSDAVADVAYVLEGALSAIAGWEGFTAEDDPADQLEWSPQHRDVLRQWLVDNYDAFSMIKAEYVEPALAKDAEKNASSLPHAGGSPAEAKPSANPILANSSSADGADATTAPPAPNPAQSALHA